MAVFIWCPRKIRDLREEQEKSRRTVGRIWKRNSSGLCSCTVWFLSFSPYLSATGALLFSVEGTALTVIANSDGKGC